MIAACGKHAGMDPGLYVVHNGTPEAQTLQNACASLERAQLDVRAVECPQFTFWLPAEHPLH